MRNRFFIFFIFLSGSFFSRAVSDEGIAEKSGRATPVKFEKQHLSIDSLKGKEKLILNGFAGIGVGKYRTPNYYLNSFSLNFLFNGSFKIHYDALTVWGFAQFLQKSADSYLATVNSDGLLIGAGFYEKDFSFVIGVGPGAIKSREYNSGITLWHGSTIYGKPSVKNNEYIGLSGGFYVAFKGTENARFALQFNTVVTARFGLFSLVVLGCEFGKR